MIKRSLLLVLVAALLVFSVACNTVRLEDYEELRAQLAEARTELNQLERQLAEAEGQKEKYRQQIESSLSQVSGLEGEISGLREQYELAGKTPADTAANIVRYYHQTHTYTSLDFYVCSDMSLDVWNMLKTQGINAVIQIGNVDSEVTSITECKHAWVMAEVAPGEYLALETTGGYVVSRGENDLYYKGWTFATPKDFKRYAELRDEYNIRAGIVNKYGTVGNQVSAEYREAIDEYNSLVQEFNQKYAGGTVTTEGRLLEQKIEYQLAIVEAKEAHYNTIKEIIDEQELALKNIMVEVERVATKVN